MVGRKEVEKSGAAGIGGGSGGDGERYKDLDGDVILRSS